MKLIDYFQFYISNYRQKNYSAKTFWPVDQIPIEWNKERRNPVQDADANRKIVENEHLKGSQGKRQRRRTQKVQRNIKEKNDHKT